MGSQCSNIVGPLLLVVKTRVDFQPIMLVRVQVPYSSSGASGTVSLATNHGLGRNRAKAQLAYPWSSNCDQGILRLRITRFSGGLCANLALVLTQFFYYKPRIERISIGHVMHVHSVFYPYSTS